MLVNGLAMDTPENYVQAKAGKWGTLWQEDEYKITEVRQCIEHYRQLARQDAQLPVPSIEDLDKAIQHIPFETGLGFDELSPVLLLLAHSQPGGERSE